MLECDVLVNRKVVKRDLKDLQYVISWLNYRNAIDAEYLLNYPSENDVVMQLPTNEEIIQGETNAHNIN